jgi:predicted RNA-binding Zn-ribbon protein involved in translation (DUF1610 family)
MNPMVEPIQFRFNLQKEVALQQEISGSHVRFRLKVIEEAPPKNPKSLVSPSITLQEQIKAEWDWGIERCIICYGQIKSDSEVAIWKCPHCGKVAHFEHVENWIQQKQKCPVCRQPVHL